MLMLTRRRLNQYAPAVLLAFTSSLGFMGAAHADSSPARIIVGFPAGGGFDAVARILA